MSILFSTGYCVLTVRSRNILGRSESCQIAYTHDRTSYLWVQSILCVCMLVHRRNASGSPMFFSVSSVRSVVKCFTFFDRGRHRRHRRREEHEKAGQLSLRTLRGFKSDEPRNTQKTQTWSRSSLRLLDKEYMSAAVSCFGRLPRSKHRKKNDYGKHPLTSVCPFSETVFHGQAHPRDGSGRNDTRTVSHHYGRCRRGDTASSNHTYIFSCAWSSVDRHTADGCHAKGL